MTVGAGLGAIDLGFWGADEAVRLLERKEEAMEPRRRHPALDHLGALVGEWEIEATHQALPGDVIRGRATFEWLEGEVFLIWRAHYDHPDIPDSIAILGCDDQGDLRNPSGGCSVHYFDQRGVTRLYHLSAEAGVWRYWRDAPGFAQRFVGRISSDGRTIDGVVELCRDESTWEMDLPITYRRVG
jgi:hypothetical protein